MPLMNKKNMSLSAASMDLGIGTNLAVQVDDQVNEMKKRQKQMQGVQQQFGPAAMDLISQGSGNGF